MTVRKTKSGKWTVDVSNGFHQSHKRIRIVRKGLKFKKEALELEQHIRVVELKENQFDLVVTMICYSTYLKKMIWKMAENKLIQVHKETIMSVILNQKRLMKTNQDSPI